MSEWKKVKIGEFLTESKVLAEESDAAHRITVRLNCKGVEKRGLKAEKEGATKYYTRYAGQFIYGKQNIHKGAFGIIPPELDGFTSSADLPAFDIDESKCVPEWIPLCLKVDERYKTLQKEVKGIGSQRLAVNVFLNVEIPLPDVSVQRKVLAKVGKKITSIALLDDETEKQKTYAKQLRQNILQEAIEGKLTADWRKQHPVQKGNPDYDAEALFEKIQQEQVLNKHQKTRSQKRVNTIDLNTPEGWKWVKLRQIIDVRDGTHDTPSYVSNGYPLITGKDFYYGFFKLDKTQYVSRKDYEIISKRSLVEVGDILFSMIGGNIGSMIQITAENFFEMAIKNVALFKNDKKGLVNQKWMYYFIKGNAKNFQNDARGGAQPFVSLNYLRDFACCLPPLAEQKEIIARVEQHIQTITQLETQIATRETTTKQLMQSILKDAFEEG